LRIGFRAADAHKFLQLIVDSINRKRPVAKPIATYLSGGSVPKTAAL
jgi:hypothetical protein